MKPQQADTMSELWNITAMSAPLTREALQAAWDRIAADARRQSTEAADRAVRFWESVPERLHGEPVVLLMACFATSGVPVHPDTHRRLKAEYEALLDDGQAVTGGGGP